MIDFKLDPVKYTDRQKFSLLSQIYGEEPETKVTKEDMYENMSYFLTSEFSDMNALDVKGFDISQALKSSKIVRSKGGIKSSFLNMKIKQQEERKKAERKNKEPRKTGDQSKTAVKKPKDEVEFYKDRCEFLASELEVREQEYEHQT